MDSILDAIALALARADSPATSAKIRLAYEAGATVGQVLAAIELGQTLGRVPLVTLDCAWAATRGLARIARPGLARYVPVSHRSRRRPAPGGRSAPPPRLAA